MKRLMLAMTAGLIFAPSTQAQFMDADDLNTFCQQKHPVAFGYVAGVLDRWSRDLHHAEMSDVVDTENNRPQSKISVTEKIRANVLRSRHRHARRTGPDRLRFRRSPPAGAWPQRRYAGAARHAGKMALPGKITGAARRSHPPETRL